MATWPVCSQAVGLQRASSVMKHEPGTLASTLAWLHRWLSSHSLAGRTASLAICTPRGVTPSSSTRKRRLWSSVGQGSGRASFRLQGLTFGENACHPEPIRGVYPERSEWAQGKLREGSGSPDNEILRCAQDDSQQADGRIELTDIRIANAPVSWGSLEFEGLKGAGIAYGQMLDELRDTGYIRTELGDWAYMPTEPAALREELERRHLAMVGAFVPAALKYPVAHSAGEAGALKVARLLAAVADTGKGSQLPFVILADANGTDPLRTQYAGRVTPEMGLSQAEWGIFAQGAERIARAVRDAAGLPTVFHHHCAGYVDTRGEIDRFLDLTAPH